MPVLLWLSSAMLGGRGWCLFGGLHLAWQCLIQDCVSREAPAGEEAAGELISLAVSQPRDELQNKMLALQGLRNLRLCVGELSCKAFQV